MKWEALEALIRQATFDGILDATAGLLEDVGGEKVTTNLIAKAAGIAQPFISFTPIFLRRMTMAHTSIGHAASFACSQLLSLTGMKTANQRRYENSFTKSQVKCSAPPIITMRTKSAVSKAQKTLFSAELICASPFCIQYV